MIAVTIVGTQDLELENLVRQAGMQVAHMDLSELSTLSAPVARQPDVVLLDVRDADRFPAAISALRRQHPETGIVMTQNPFWAETAGAGLRFYFMPEDDTSRVFVYDAKVN